VRPDRVCTLEPPNMRPGSLSPMRSTSKRLGPCSSACQTRGTPRCYCVESRCQQSHDFRGASAARSACRVSVASSSGMPASVRSALKSMSGALLVSARRPICALRAALPLITQSGSRKLIPQRQHLRILTAMRGRYAAVDAQPSFRRRESRRGLGDRRSSRPLRRRRAARRRERRRPSRPPARQRSLSRPLARCAGSLPASTFSSARHDGLEAS